MSEQGTPAARRWEVPPVEDQPPADNSEPGERLTVRDIEAIQKQAYEDGFALGQQEGRAAMQPMADEFSAVLSRLSEPLADLDDEVVHDLILLVKAITRKLVRREMRADPGQIIAVVREAIGTLPSSARDIQVHLHPDDVSLIREKLAISDENAAWSLVEDPVMQRGDCTVVTGSSRIDASLESRLNALVASMLGGDRDSERR